jgi:hypothetical protein
LQREQAPAAHGPAQALVPDTVTLAAQSDLQPSRAIAALVSAEDLDQRRFPSRLLLATCLRLSLLPRIITAGRHRDYLAKQAHGVLIPLRFDKAIAAHGLSVTESLRLKQATGNGFF